MGNDAPLERITILWSPEARADLRAIDRDTAMQILYCVDRYLGLAAIPLHVWAS
jgi:hypothetical protein